MVSRVFEKFVLIASSVCGCCSMAVCAQEVRQAEPEARTGAANVVSWEAMTPAERQALWPMLTHEQRLFPWRQMNRAERKVFEKGLTEDEKRIIKRRFVIDSRLLEAAANRPQRKLTDDERRLLRQQIMEVHIEIRRGVPYNCTDPTNCPKSSFRHRQAREAADAVPNPVSAVPSAADHENAHPAVPSDVKPAS